MTLDPGTVLKVEGLHKKFCRHLRRSMLYGSTDMTKAMLGIPVDSGSLRDAEFWALENVSFALKAGEALGVIGQNGSGKTTLLRIINGIFPPDRGRVSVRGRIGALLAVGAGFHPHLTGRENIHLNGLILGMSPEEIRRKFDEIIAFADIGDFLDAPVATYSSGMAVRLGFSVAVHATPDILLADEVLAVGDLSFALKCYKKVSEYIQQGGSVILVSHSMQAIRNACQKALWLDERKMKAFGEAQPVCNAYETHMLSKIDRSDAGSGIIINNDPSVRIASVEFLDAAGTPRMDHKAGDPMTTRISFECKRRVDRPIITVSFSDPENIQVISNYTIFDGFRIDHLEGKGHVDFTINQLMLKPSEYRCTITLTESENVNNILEWHDKAHRFKVTTNGSVYYGLYNPLPKWALALNR